MLAIRLTLVFIFIFLASANPAIAQSYITGKVSDAETLEPVESAHVSIYAPEDTSFVAGTSTNAEGNFILRDVSEGAYLLSVSYIGYKTHQKNIEIDDEPITDLSFEIKQTDIIMDELVVRAPFPAVEVAGDTVRHYARAYRLGEYATVRELIRRLPGFTIVDGQIEAEGEQIDRILVDGKEFFGDDGTLALDNLPAEIIERVELYDRRSDQAEFTGFDDGDEERAVNLVVREDRNYGQFGRGETGAGNETRYTGGGNYNFFQAERRLSLIGITNNINQRQFAPEDIQEARQGGRGRGRPSRFDDLNFGGVNGLSTYHSLGANYIDEWGGRDQWSINGSFNLDFDDFSNEAVIDRRYTMAPRDDQLYDEHSLTERTGFNPRLNLRMEYEIDELRSLRFQSRLRTDFSNAYSVVDGTTYNPDGTPVNELLNETDHFERQLDGSQSLLYRRRLNEEGRTFSVDFSGSISDSRGDLDRLSETLFYSDEMRSESEINDQETDIFSRQTGLEADFNYTEPVGEDHQILLRYTPSWQRDQSDRETYLLDEDTGEYQDFSNTLSHRYTNNIYRQRTGASFRSNIGDIHSRVNLDYQYSLLQGSQRYPFETDTRRTYHNLLPAGMLLLPIGEDNQLRLTYNTHTQAPSAIQLMEGIDDSDPLRLQSGNPELDQQYSHIVRTLFRMSTPRQNNYTMIHIRFQRTENNISQSTFVAAQDTLIQDGITLRAGSQLIRPENVGTSRSLRTNISRGFPIEFIESNLNLNAGFSYNYTPIFVNENRSQRQNYAINSGLHYSTNFSENFRLRFNYNGSYQIIEEASGQTRDDNYYTGRAGLDFNYETGSGITFGTEANYRHNHGLPEEYSQNTLYWNLIAGYKFLENNAGHLQLRGVDLLNQNDSIDRIVAYNYIEDVQNNVLSRYFMLSFTYNFRSFPRGEGPSEGRRGARR